MGISEYIFALQDTIADNFLKSIDWSSTTRTCKSMDLTSLLSKHAQPELDINRLQNTICNFNLTPAVENKTTPLGKLGDAVNDMVLWNIDWVRLSLVLTKQTIK